MKVLSKSNIAFITSLHLHKFRQKYQKFIVEGYKSNIEFLKKQKYDLDMLVFSQEDVKMQLEKEVDVNEMSIVYCSPPEMKKISCLVNPSDVLGVYTIKETDVLNLSHLNGNMFILDNVQDPGNCGTIIRIADWFGFSTVIRVNNGADFYHPKVVQASMGSLNNVDLISIDDSNLLSELPFSIYALDMNGVPIVKSTLPAEAAYILGSEGQGVSQALMDMCKDTLSILGANGRTAESLNVAITAGIIAHHTALL